MGKKAPHLTIEQGKPQLPPALLPLYILPVLTHSPQSPHPCGTSSSTPTPAHQCLLGAALGAALRTPALGHPDYILIFWGLSHTNSTEFSPASTRHCEFHTEKHNWWCWGCPTLMSQPSGYSTHLESERPGLQASFSLKELKTVSPAAQKNALLTSP